jgi:hypothetical protein
MRRDGQTDRICGGIRGGETVVDAIGIWTCAWRSSNLARGVHPVHDYQLFFPVLRLVTKILRITMVILRILRIVAASNLNEFGMH